MISILPNDFRVCDCCLKKTNKNKTKNKQKTMENTYFFLFDLGFPCIVAHNLPFILWSWRNFKEENPERNNWCVFFPKQYRIKYSVKNCLPSKQLPFFYCSQWDWIHTFQTWQKYKTARDTSIFAQDCLWFPGSSRAREDVSCFLKTKSSAEHHSSTSERITSNS